MKFIVLKYVITAFIIVGVSEIAKRSDKVGALISSLPLVTVLVMSWLYIEGQGREKIANHAYYTFWYVLPTLPMFLAMPVLINRGVNFWLALGACGLLTFGCFLITAAVGRVFGVNLL